MRRENTDKIEMATDLRVVADRSINTAIQQAGSDPLHSLFEGDSRLSSEVRAFSTTLNSGHQDTRKLKMMRSNLLESAALSLRMVAMIDNELDRVN